MSVNEYEHGTIKFTKVGYMELARHIRQRFNESQVFLFDSALEVYSQLNEIKGSKARQAAFEGLFTYRHNGCFVKKAPYHSTQSISIDDKYMIRGELFRGANNSLCKPRKSAFAHLTNKATSFDVPLGDDGHFNLCADDKMLFWHIDTNNHAVRDARNSPMAGFLFTYLNKYKWRKGEGGTFSYWSEYTNEDNDDCDNREGDETISSYFGAIGQEHKKHEIEMMHHRFNGR